MSPRLVQRLSTKTKTISNFFNILTLQTKSENTDAQFSYFYRYADVHSLSIFLVIYFSMALHRTLPRESNLNGIQADGSYTLNDQHKLQDFTPVTVTAEDAESL